MRNNLVFRRLLHASLLALAALSAASMPSDAQQTPYAPGDWQGRTIVLQGSTLQSLNIDTETQNGVITAGAFGESVYQPGVNATGNSLATCYNLTTSAGAATTLINGGAAGTGLCLSANIVYGGYQTIINTDTVYHYVYPTSSTASIDGNAAGVPIIMPPNGWFTVQRIGVGLPWRTVGSNIHAYAAAATWRTSDTVANGTSVLIWSLPWGAATVETVMYGTAAGTFTANVQVAPSSGGTPVSVTGCGALSVTTTPTTTACTITPIVGGGELTVVVSSAASSPNGAAVQVTGHAIW